MGIIQWTVFTPDKGTSLKYSTAQENSCFWSLFVQWNPLNDKLVKPLFACCGCLFQMADCQQFYWEWDPSNISTQRKRESISRMQGIREPNGTQSTACIFCMVWETAQVVQKHDLADNQLLSNRLLLSSKRVMDVFIVYSLLNQGLNSSSLSQTVLQDKSEREGPYRPFSRRMRKSRSTLCDSPMLALSQVLDFNKHAHNALLLLTQIHFLISYLFSWSGRKVPT